MNWKTLEPGFALVLAFSAVLAAAGCYSASLEKLENGQSYWFHYDATRRGSVVIAGEGKIRVCSEPSPDAAVSFLSQFLASAKVKEQGGEAKYDLSSQIVELGKRTETVQFLRESLFRLCELSVNSDLDSATVKELFLDVISAAREIAMADRAEADARKLESLNRLPEVSQKLYLQQGGK